jgi:hypothetical protein
MGCGSIKFHEIYSEPNKPTPAKPIQSAVKAVSKESIPVAFITTFAGDANASTLRNLRLSGGKTPYRHGVESLLKNKTTSTTAAFSNRSRAVSPETAWDVVERIYGEDVVSR